MSYKSDVKPIYIASSSTNAVAFTGRTRLRGLVIQSTGSSGSMIINGLANATTEQKQQLASLEKQLNVVASQISQSSTQFKDNNKLVSNQSIKNVKGINTYLNDLNNTNEEINNFSENISSNLNNILNDSDIFVLQQNYDYLFWAILASGLVLVSMNILK